MQNDASIEEEENHVEEEENHVEEEKSRKVASSLVQMLSNACVM